MPKDKTAKGRVPSQARRRAARTPSQSTSEILKLDTECTIEQAKSLQSRLLELAERSGPVTLDASSTQRIDAASLQLLAAFVRDRAARGLDVSWKNAIPVIAGAARRTGLQTLLRLPAGEPARA